MMKPLYDPTIFCNELESIDQEKYIITTFYFENTIPGQQFIDHLAMVQRAGLLGATGAWVDLKGESQEVRDRLCFKIIGYYELPHNDNMRRAVVQFAYPLDAFTPNLSSINIPAMMQSPFGNVLMFPGKCKVLGINFPQSLTEQFTGPKFGIEGIRKAVNVQGRPLLMTIGKPKMGMTPQQVAKQIYEAAIGGSDLYKDDEAFTETWNCSFDNRLDAALESLEKAHQETGRKILYFITVTDEVDRIMEKVQRAVSKGANGFLLCCSAGWSALRVMARAKEINTPILYHITTSSLYLERMSFAVFNKISRLCGADILLIPPCWGTLPVTTMEDEIRSVQTLQAPFHNIRRTFPMMGGGLYPGLVPSIVKQYGKDIIFEVGSGVHGHPGGTRVGCEAFLEAIDAAVAGVPLEKASQNKPHLKSAIEKWGIFRRPIMPFDGLYAGCEPKHEEEQF